MKYLTIILITGLLSCQNTTRTTTLKDEIMQVLVAQENAWNEGDIEGYMQGYLKSDSLRFASGENVSFGWQTTFERYTSGYPDKNTMGQLTFSEIDISVISDNTALVFGKWELERDSDHPWGLFTLLFKKTPKGWFIVHDHTSSAN